MPEPTPQVTPAAPKFNTHKVFAAIGIILIVAIIFASGLWYFTEGNSSSDNEGTTVKVSTSSAKPKTSTTSSNSSSKKDETADWKIFTSTKWSFSVKYPKDWEIAKDVDLGASLMKTEIYGEPGVGFSFKNSDSTSFEPLYSRIKSYQVNQTVEYKTTMDNPPGSGNLIKDTYKRLSDTKVDGKEALRYTISFGYKDVGVNESYNYLIKNGDQIFWVQIIPLGMTMSQAQTLLDNMLSTFKFL